MKVRPIRIEGDIAYVPLTKGYEAIIDAADVPLVDGFNWMAQECRRRDGSVRTAYAARNTRLDDGGQTLILMHRALLRATCGMQCDHIDGNGLDNRRTNLRLATASENGRNRGAQANNRAGVKGVYWSKRDGKWVAQIKLHQHPFYLGSFAEIADAAAAYAQASADIHAEFGRTR